MILDFTALDETKAYKAMSCSIFPRPIAWIVTEDEDVVNIAPFSYFAPLSKLQAADSHSVDRAQRGR